MTTLTNKAREEILSSTFMESLTPDDYIKMVELFDKHLSLSHQAGFEAGVRESAEELGRRAEIANEKEADILIRAQEIMKLLTLKQNK